MTATRSASGTRLGDRAARRTAGIESVTWRGRASSGATPGTGSSHRSCGRGLALADRRDPRPVGQPADRPPDAVPRVDPAARRRGRGTVRGVFGGRPRPRFGAAPAPSSPTSRSWSPSWTSTWTNRLPSGDGSGHVPDAAVRLAVLALARRQDDPVVAVGGQPDDLEPAVRVRDVEQRAVGSQRPPTSTLRSPATTRVAPVGDVDEGDLRRLDPARVAMGHDREARAVGRPLEGIDVEAGRGHGRRPRRLRVRGRPAAARDGRVDEPDLGPAARARQEREAVAVGRPARVRARRPACRRRASGASRRPRRTQISSSRTNARRRPSGDHCGSETGFSDAVSWVG